MPLPDADLKIVELVVRGTLTAGGASVKNCFNVYTYRRTTFINPASKTQFAQAFAAAVLVPLAAAANVRWAANRMSVRFLSDALDQYVDVADASVGAIATDSEPNNDAVYCLLKTGVRGRFAQGSKHFGGTSEIDTTDNILVGAGLARWQTVKNALNLPVVDAGPNTWVPSVVSRTYSILNVNPTTVISNDVVNTFLNKRIGSMAHRKAVSVY